jgi:hypothetical protein
MAALPNQQSVYAARQNSTRIVTPAGGNGGAGGWIRAQFGTAMAFRE